MPKVYQAALSPRPNCRSSASNTRRSSTILRPPPGHRGPGSHYFGPPPAEDLTCVLVRAKPEDVLFHFDAQYETTGTPCELIWGPGRWQQAVEWLKTEQPTADTVRLLDRVFLIRHHESRVYLPRHPDLTAGLNQQDRTGEWLLIRADHSLNVFSHALPATGGQ